MLNEHINNAAHVISSREYTKYLIVRLSLECTRILLFNKSFCRSSQTLVKRKLSEIFSSIIYNDIVLYTQRVPVSK